jgi:hypothetical protein
MAVLEHALTGARHPLASRTLVGRSHACQLRLDSQRVSSVHAQLAWDGERWLLHDLGSRNGTHLDGRRVHAEHREPLATGSELVFGTAGERYLLVDASPPGLVAVADDGRVAQAEARLLCLPSEDDPEVTLLEQLDGRWQLETEQGSRPLVDQDQVNAGGVAWRIHLPGPAQYTDDGGEAPMSVGTIRLELKVSRDEESMVMRVHHEGRAIELRPRAHDFFLLALARARLADQAQAGLAEAEHGWVYRQDLARDLQIDRNLLNLWIYRARRQFTEAGVLDVASLVERRPGSEQLRLGIARLRVRSG